MKKKYAFAGASARAYSMFAENIVNHFSEYAEMVGIYDINYKRAEVFSSDFGNFPVFRDFDEMLQETKPDTVIVTTVDAFHSDYIIRSLKAGCDVITEKPMTTDKEKCEAILEAEKESGKKVTVTFNYRYAPYMTEIKKFIAEGNLGEIYSVDFEWTLDRVTDILGHGASYFRRWNRYMKNSGGLLVHKSTHHFDLVNWWIDQDPEQVFAYGKLNLYGKNGKFRGKNCRECEHKNECEFYEDITKDWYIKKYYTDCEDVDGYNKDACIFAEDIDIYDTMSVNVKYRQGAILNYTLNATAAYEGWRMSINGSKGRLEADHPESGIRALDDTLKLTFYDLSGNIITREIPKLRTGHGGGDVRLLKSVFVGKQEDPLGHQAGTLAGANSILIGASANISIKENRPVMIDEGVPMLKELLEKKK